MVKTRYRLQFKFWLDMNRAGSEEIADQIGRLKNERSYTDVIRDGIRLICDLRAGRLDVLLSLFPWITEAILDSRAGGGDGRTADIQRQLDQLERLLLSQDGGQVMAPVASNGGPKLLAAAAGNRPAPPDDDDMPALKIVQAKSTGNASANFIASAFALQ